MLTLSKTIVPLLGELFVGSNKATDYQLRREMLEESIEELHQMMKKHCENTNAKIRSSGLDRKLSLRVVKANDVYQLTWFFLRIKTWKNKRDGAISVSAPLAALAQHRRAELLNELAQYKDFLVALNRYERERLSFNYQSKSLTYITNCLESQEEFRRFSYG